MKTNLFISWPISPKFSLIPFFLRTRGILLRVLQSKAEPNWLRS